MMSHVISARSATSSVHAQASHQCMIATAREVREVLVTWLLKGKREGGRFKREGMYVCLWLIHVDVWQKPTPHCKATILQFKIDKLLKRQTEQRVCETCILLWTQTAARGQGDNHTQAKSTHPPPPRHSTLSHQHT